MYLPESEFQVPLADLQLDQSLQNLPNVTKEISDILKLCDAAGLEPHGLGCGLSIAFVLTLAAALLVAIFIVLIPAIASLVVGAFTAVGNVITAVVLGLTAAFLAIIAGITSLFAITSRTIVKIVSLPFRPCLRGQDPLSPLDNSEAGGVINGQISYSREQGVLARPPSYHSEDESPGAIQNGK